MCIAAELFRMRPGVMSAGAAEKTSWLPLARKATDFVLSASIAPFAGPKGQLVAGADHDLRSQRKRLIPDIRQIRLLVRLVVHEENAPKPDIRLSARRPLVRSGFKIGVRGGPVFRPVGSHAPLEAGVITIAGRGCDVAAVSGSSRGIDAGGGRGRIHGCPGAGCVFRIRHRHRIGHQGIDAFAAFSL